MRRIAWAHRWPRLRVWVGSRGGMWLSHKAGLRACADQHPASQQQVSIMRSALGCNRRPADFSRQAMWDALVVAPIVEE